MWTEYQLSSTDLSGAVAVESTLSQQTPDVIEQGGEVPLLTRSLRSRAQRGGSPASPRVSLLLARRHMARRRLRRGRK